MRMSVAVAGACAAAVMGLGLFAAGVPFVPSAPITPHQALAEEAAGAEASLRAEFEASGCNALYFWCADFDHNGSYEAFAIDGTLEDPLPGNDGSDGGVVGGTLWFTAGSGTTRMLGEIANAHPTLSPSGLQSGTDHDFLSICIYGHGSGATSKSYTVYNGEPILVDLSSDLSWLSQDSHGQGVQDAGKPATYEMPDCSKATSLEEFASWLDIADREVEYSYRATSFEDFDWVVSDNLANETPVGSLVKDYDGDGENELLVAVWRDGAIDLDMYELVDGMVTRVARMSDGVTVSDHPAITGDCVFNVLSNDTGAIYLQWWQDANPRASGFGWNVKRIGYTNGVFAELGTAHAGGSGGIEFDDLRTSMDGIGLDTSYVPSGLDDAFIHSDLAECDSSLTLVTKAVGSVDGAQGVYDAVRNASAENPASGQLGTFKIGPQVASPEKWAWTPPSSGANAAPTYADVAREPMTSSVSTKNGTIQYSYYWDANVDIAASDGGSRTLHSFYITNLSYAPSSAASGEYVEGFILTSGNHCIHWSGQATGGSLAIDQLWYTEDGASYPVTTTSYDIDGFHWFGHDTATGDFRIS